MLTLDRGLSILGLAAAIAGVVAAYYFYRVSVQERVPTFLIDPITATIIDSSGPNLSDLTVLFKGKPVGQRNVAAVRIYFWNAGRMPIRRADVLKPVQCVLRADAEILEARVLKSSRDVTGFKIIPSANPTENRVTFDFDILEKDDGAAIQVIYAGPPRPGIHFEGVLVGVPGLFLESAKDPRQTVESARRSSLRAGLTGIICGVVVLLAVALQSLFGAKIQGAAPRSSFIRFWQRLPFRNRTTRIAAVVAGILYIAMGAYLAFYHPKVLGDVPRVISMEP